MKQKFISLGLALAMLLGVAGCNVTTPATVGTIGGVEIPAGIYLLAQYNAYNTTASLVDFATGESADDVKVVLNAQVTGTINGEEVTTDGADYIHRLTLSSIEYYAATEALFDQLGATLEDAATSEVATTADSMWESNGDVYEANGIARTTLEKYLTNAQKAAVCLQALYGPDGQEPVTDGEYEQFVQEDCRYIESVVLPMVDYSTYTYAFTDATMESAIEAIADECVNFLTQNTGTEPLNDYAAMYQAASQYVPRAMAVLGSTAETAQAGSFVSGSLYLPNDLANYDDDNGGNLLTDALDEAGMGCWTKINLTSSLVVARQMDPLKTYDIDTYKESYDLLGAMKQDELRDRLYADGAAMEHQLDEGAMNTYKASNIKHSV